MPAGVSYWQTGTFKLYHHNPPLVKLVAALPVVAESTPMTAQLYQMESWANESQATFGQSFACVNLPRLPRAVRPGPAGDAAVLGPGRAGGLRLVEPALRGRGAGCSAWRSGASARTSWPTGGSSPATWRRPRSGPGRPICSGGIRRIRPGRGPSSPGLALGLAQLTKFSLVLLYGLWPALAVVRFLLERRWEGWPRRLAVGLGQWAAMVALSVLVIDIGYGFEGVGTPLGKFEFASRSLTMPVPPGMARPD